MCVAPFDYSILQKLEAAKEKAEARLSGSILKTRWSIIEIMLQESTGAAF